MEQVFEKQRKNDTLADEKKRFELRKMKTLDNQHSGEVQAVLHFGPPHNLIASCSNDSTIRIFCSLTFECQKVIEEHTDYVRDMIKMNETTFISCSDDKTILCFSICPIETLKKIRVNSYSYRLHKLTEDLFLDYCGDDLLLLSYSQASIKRLEFDTRLSYASPPNPLLLSEKYPNCFYVATESGVVNKNTETINLYDFEDDIVVKEFQAPSQSENERFRSLSLFHSSRNEEFLIAIQTAFNILCFNTAQPQKALFLTGSFGTSYHVERFMSNVFCSEIVNNQYLFLGDRVGKISGFELFENEGKISILEKMKVEVHSGGRVCDMEFMEIGNHRTEIGIVSCSSNRTIVISRITGIDLRGKEDTYEYLDRKERIHYLFHETEALFFDMAKGFVLEVRTRNFGISNVPKILLRQ